MKNKKHLSFFAVLFAVSLILVSLVITGCNEDEALIPEVDISEYTESENYHVEKTFETEYGTALYFWPVGTPHGGINACLILVKEDGTKISLSQDVPREDLWHTPQFDDISLSEDGKNILFSVSFNERSEANVSDSEPVVLHEAGKYYFSSDLEKGKTELVRFEPAEKEITDYYEFHNVLEFEPAFIKLYSDGTYHFFYSVLSSNYIIGKYEWKSEDGVEKLNLHRENDEYKYVFEKDNDGNLVFDEKNSFPIERFKYSLASEAVPAVPDKALFEKKA
jgi:hypothetical protein